MTRRSGHAVELLYICIFFGLILKCVGPLDPTKPDTDHVDAHFKEHMEIFAPPEDEINIVVNTRVRKEIRKFISRGEIFKIWLRGSGRYIPMIKSVLREYDLPGDLVYLAMIESGFNPNAYSRAGAAGLWQFIVSTGRKYGLRIDQYVDERFDPVRSSVAGARYLKHLFELFGDWHLAIAAYNAGENAIISALASQKTDDFWSLNLSAETERFVPKFMAAVHICKNPARYGLAVVGADPLEYDQVTVEGSVSLEVIARSCEVTPENIRELNPQLRRRVTPPEKYTIRIPKGRRKLFAANFAKLSREEKLASWGRHKVSRGETLSRIARRYGTSVGMLARVNGLQNPHRLSVGQSLIVPKSTEVGDSEGGLVRNIYIVKRGDTLSRIAQMFQTRVSYIRRWNNLEDSRIYPDQKLVVYSRWHPISYNVAPGDTLWALARRYNTTVELIKSWNSKKGSLLLVGERLVIPVSLN